jgi:chitin synthase
MASHSGSTGGTHSLASLVSLPEHMQTDTNLTAHLASRFHAGLPTATLSSHALIAFNTYTSSTKGTDGGKEGSAMAGAEEMADRAFLRLGHRTENQAFLFVGESGSGKSTIRSHLVTALLNKSSSLLSQKVSLATYVFDTLTTTKTATTPTASKAGLFYELQYDTSSTATPQLIGSKLLDHRLERSRITNVPTGERNFHVLYYLLAGTSGAEQEHLGLSNQVRWRYLGHPTQLKVGINDSEGFAMFKNALRKLEFQRTEIAEMCQVLAAILHIGQLDFETTADTTPQADDSGGFSHEGSNTITAAKNKEVLTIVAAFLGVAAADLQTTLGYKTKMIHKERVTVMLDPAGARAHANELARTLYSLLVAYVVESINKTLCATEENISNTISIIDFPGFVQQSTASSSQSALDQLLNNSACEALYNLTLQNFFDRKADMFDSEEVTVKASTYFDNSDTVKGLLKPGNGLLSILDDQARRNRTDLQFLDALRKRFEGKNPAIAVTASQAKLPGSNFYTDNAAAAFTIKHFAGEVDYPVRGIIEENGEIISADLLNLINGTKSEFVARLVGQEVLQTVTHPHERSTVMQATISSKPMRAPSVVSRKTSRAGRAQQAVLRRQETERQAAAERASSEDADGPAATAAKTSEQGASGQFLSSLENVQRAVSDPNCNTYLVFCLKPNDRRIANQFDSKCVRAQVQTLGIAEISNRLRHADISVFLPFGELLGLTDMSATFVGSEREQAEALVMRRGWPENEARVGATGVLMSERCWLEVARHGDANSTSRASGAGAGLLAPSDAGDGMERDFGASKERLLSTVTPLAGTLNEKSDRTRSVYLSGGGLGGSGGGNDDARSVAGTAFNGEDMFHNLETRENLAEKGNEKALVEVEEYKDSASRKRWVGLVYTLTWFVPDFLIRVLGRMPRKDIRMAWREKLAINLIIWFFCLLAAFFIVVFPMLICPKQNVYSASELSAYDGKGDNDAYAAIRGWVYDIGAYAPRHYPSFVGTTAINKYAGMDITNLFPVQVSALCAGKAGSVNSFVTLDYKSTNLTGQPTILNSADRNAKYHDFRAFRNDSRPDWYFEQMTVLRSNYLKGKIGYSAQYVNTLADTKQQSIAILNNRVYDMTEYIQGGRRMPVADDGRRPPSDESLVDFMNDDVVSLFRTRAGEDITELYNNLRIDAAMRRRMNTCLNNLFYLGDVDTRNSIKCQFADYLVLAVSVLLCSVIGFKFLAALQFGTKNVPENLERFIMCQIPAYTEDEESLRRAIDSAARMKYDDKRKLLVIVCDGMIIGQGNDRPTPRIVLDILGVPEGNDPEPLSFEALGEGLKQHNMGKVYTGLYEVQGHIVPFLVIVKVGKPSEVGRPGNRGKRDSQMIIMRFLNRVHYNLAMSPMELEMYHQIRNIIGVNPAFYEFMMQIDADTVVAADSANRFVSAMINDTKLIAVCGETALTNAKGSFVTMIQVYEYYISHNLSKAFESLFGSVTCLPGCFSMYRIREETSGKPLFVSKEVVDAYSTIRVDTLHMKNLLHLGEDRYLTTLLLKYHSRFKTKYIFRAHAWTIAPDSWQVFLSQRRRWINSTVHNLIELIPLDQLCGFCCFSMRFIVFVDLLSTVVQPVTMAYITYLIVMVITKATVVPMTAFILLAAIYGLQAIIFITRRKWEMIGWMILYVLATPVFSFALPLYSFWHMDDFNWGNTRVVAGESGKKIVVSDEGKFDPASIPKKKWEEYQAELAETATVYSEYAGGPKNGAYVTQGYLGAGGYNNDDTRSEVSGYSYATRAGMGAANPFAPGMGMGTGLGAMGMGGGASSEYNMGMGGGGPGSVYMAGNNSSHNLLAAQLDHARAMNNPSRLSIAHSEMPLGNMRMSQYNGSQFFGGATPGTPGPYLGGGGGGSGADDANLPSDDMLYAEVKNIIANSDLMLVTKKDVKATLEARFGVNLDAKKAYIYSATLTEVQRRSAPGA